MQLILCSNKKLMKNILKTASALLIMIVLFGACSKEHKIRKNLSGTWKLTSTTDSIINAALLLGATAQYQFSDCKKKDEPCNGVYTISYNLLGFPISISANYTWIVKDDVLSITPSDSLLAPGSFHIEFIDKKKLTATDVSNASNITTLEEL